MPTGKPGVCRPPGHTKSRVHGGGGKHHRLQKRPEQQILGLSMPPCTGARCDGPVLPTGSGLGGQGVLAGEGVWPPASYRSPHQAHCSRQPPRWAQHNPSCLHLTANEK